MAYLVLKFGANSNLYNIFFLKRQIFPQNINGFRRVRFYYSYKYSYSVINLKEILDKFLG